MIKIISKDYSIWQHQTMLQKKDHKLILEDYKNMWGEDGIKRSDFGKLDFDTGDKSVCIRINDVTNPIAWKVFEQDYVYTLENVRDSNGKDYDVSDGFIEISVLEPEDLKKSSIEARTESKQVRPYADVVAENEKDQKRKRPFINCFGIKIE